MSDNMTTNEALGMLAHHALTQLWQNSDFQPRNDENADFWGCCPKCCAPCGALLYLDQAGELDQILYDWPEGVLGSDIFPNARLDREWMYRQWSNPAMPCRHKPLDAPTPSRKR